MEKDKKFRALAIAAICVAVVGVSIAYAALSASLTITGTVTVDSRWDLKWVGVPANEEAITKTSGVTVTAMPTIDGTGSQNITWEAKFAMPTDSISFDVTFKNNGTMPAKLDSGEYLAITGDAAAVKLGTAANVDPFTYTVKHGDADISSRVGYVLEAGKEVTLTVTVVFDEGNVITNEQLAAINGKSAEFTLTLPWSQATDADVTAAGTKKF